MYNWQMLYEAEEGINLEQRRHLNIWVLYYIVNRVDQDYLKADIESGLAYVKTAFPEVRPVSDLSFGTIDTPLAEVL